MDASIISSIVVDSVDYMVVDNSQRIIINMAYYYYYYCDDVDVDDVDNEMLILI